MIVWKKNKAILWAFENKNNKNLNSSKWAFENKNKHKKIYSS